MSPQPEASSARLSPDPSPPNEFSAAERALLLQLAHDAIESILDEREISLDPPSPHLAGPRGAFTTLYYRGKLRGCVGYVAPVVSLYATVVETARGAAFEDSRFLPVTRAVAPELEVSLSILSQLQPIQPEAIEIGRHGLVVSLGACRGLLLPQVPAENDWDRVTFLEQTCRKAGLRLDAWRAGAKIEAFTAEVFGDCRR
jgi:AmmeMemoRadiSam system protein A